MVFQKRWPNHRSLRTPGYSNSFAVSNEAFAAYCYANLMGVQSLYSSAGYSLIAWTKPSTLQFHQTARVFTFGNKVTVPANAERDPGVNGNTAGITIAAITSSFQSTANSGVNFQYTAMTATGSGTFFSTEGVYLSGYQAPLDIANCVAWVTSSLDGPRKQQLYVNGTLYLNQTAASSPVIYNPGSERFYVNKTGQANIDVMAVALITGPISSLDAIFLSSHTPEQFAEISSYQVYAWHFDGMRDRYPETTGKSPFGSYDFFRNTSISSNYRSDWALSDSSIFWPDYHVRLHDQSADGQILVNSANDINLTPYATHVTITRNVGNFFHRQSAGIAQVALSNVSSGVTPWTQSKMREDGGLSVTAFYGGSLHVLFSGYIKDIAVSRGQANKLDATITAHDSIGLFRREYISERYRQNTVINSYFSQVVSGGVKRTYSSITAIGVNVPLIYTKEKRSIDEVLNRMASFYNPWQWLGYRVNSQAGSLSLINVLRAEPHSYAISATAADTITEFYGLSARTDTEKIINRLEVKISPRQSSLSQVTSGAGIALPIMLTAQSTLALYFFHADAQAAEWDGIPGEVQSTFTAVTHFVFNTKSDGTGTNMNANLTVVATSYGVKGLYIVGNSHASSTGYLTQFITQPRVFKTLGEGVVTSQSSSSQVSYGLRHASIDDNPWHQVEADTRSFAHYMVDRYKTPIPTIEASFKKFTNCFYNVGAVVSLVDSISNTGGKYIITSVDYDIAMERGKEQTLRITGEKHE